MPLVMSPSTVCCFSVTLTLSTAVPVPKLMLPLIIPVVRLKPSVFISSSVVRTLPSWLHTTTLYSLKLPGRAVTSS